MIFAKRILMYRDFFCGYGQIKKNAIPHSPT